MTRIIRFILPLVLILAATASEAAPARKSGNVYTITFGGAL